MKSYPHDEPGLNVNVMKNADGQYSDQQIRDEVGKRRMYLTGNKALITPNAYKTDPAGRTTLILH